MTSAVRWAPLALSLALLGCGHGPMTATPDAGPVKPTTLVTGSEGALTVELATLGPLQVGQNRVFYTVKQGGQPVTRATLAQKPVMKMATMQHACPLQNPAAEANADGAFEGLLVFNMASTEMERWSLAVQVQVEGAAAPVTVSLGEVAVAESTLKKVLTWQDKKVVVTYGYPAAPHVGANEVVITAHVAKDMMMMDFVPVDGLAFTLTPEMPSMGHGSAGNVNPVRGADGLYRGTVVFSMPGDWVVHVGVKGGEADLATYDFALDL